MAEQPDSDFVAWLNSFQNEISLDNSGLVWVDLFSEIDGGAFYYDLSGLQEALQEIGGIELEGNPDDPAYPFREGGDDFNPADPNVRGGFASIEDAISFIIRSGLSGIADLVRVNDDWYIEITGS